MARVPIIETGLAPAAPKGLEIYYHRGVGRFALDSKVWLYMPQRQTESFLNGHSLRVELDHAEVSTLPANVLDAYLQRPEHVPENLRVEGQFSFFWGTIFRDTGNRRLSVRHLYFDGREFGSYHRWLVIGFNADDPAVAMHQL